MTKAELVEKMAENAGISKKQAQLALDSFVGAIEHVFNIDDKISIPSLGTFKVAIRKGRPARMGRNPRTGETVNLPATSDRQYLKFTPVKEMK